MWEQYDCCGQNVPPHQDCCFRGALLEIIVYTVPTCRNQLLGHVRAQNTEHRDGARK